MPFFKWIRFILLALVITSVGAPTNAHAGFFKKLCDRLLLRNSDAPALVNKPPAVPQKKNPLFLEPGTFFYHENLGFMTLQVLADRPASDPTRFRFWLPANFPIKNPFSLYNEDLYADNHSNYLLNHFGRMYSWYALKEEVGKYIDQTAEKRVLLEKTEYRMGPLLLTRDKDGTSIESSDINFIESFREGSSRFIFTNLNLTEIEQDPSQIGSGYYHTNKPKTDLEINGNWYHIDYDPREDLSRFKIRFLALMPPNKNSFINKVSSKFNKTWEVQQAELRSLELRRASQNPTTSDNSGLLGGNPYRDIFFIPETSPARQISIGPLRFEEEDKNLIVTLPDTEPTTISAFVKTLFKDFNLLVRVPAYTP